MRVIVKFDMFARITVCFVAKMFKNATFKCDDGTKRGGRQQKAIAAGYRTREDTDGLLRPPFQGGAKHPISVLEQILGRKGFSISRTALPSTEPYELKTALLVRLSLEHSGKQYRGSRVINSVD